MESHVEQTIPTASQKQHRMLANHDHNEQQRRFLLPKEVGPPKKSDAKSCSKLLNLNKNLLDLLTSVELQPTTLNL